ncbi:MAG: 4Fe-4S binding protein, partial [Proteobacteria bacterium]|nr:4Fe-4S binding protein [Pseudomonadota bacterium]
MSMPNEADKIRRQVKALVVRAVMDGKLEDIDRIAVSLRPKNGPSSRCCVYKDRAAIRYRCMALLGFRLGDEEDEPRLLSDYAREALERYESDIRPREPFLTVMTMGCSACLESQTIVTNLCRGCFARPCTTVCRKDAISVQNGRAIINREHCVDCGLCTRVCPYKAIVSMPLACHDACPVDAVKKDSFGRVFIDHALCIHCGKCVTACPFAAIIECSELIDVLAAIKSKRKPVIAMPAPSLAGIFPGTMGQITAALRKAGFDEVYDVSAGAELTSKVEAHEFSERMEGGAPFMTTSCCPAWIEAVKKHIPEMLPFVSDAGTPMQYTADLARKDYPDATVVFIGPCHAKRVEALRDARVDYVLTVDELEAIFRAMEIDIEGLEAMKPAATGKRSGRGFAVTGGVSRAVSSYLEKPDTLRAMPIQ